MALFAALLGCLSSSIAADKDKKGADLSRARDMIERWAALAYLEAERRFRKIQGHRDLWILAQALGRTAHKVDRHTKAA